MDEYFNTFSDEKLPSQSLYDNEGSFLDDILMIHKAKHYKHLRYLSDKHLGEKMRLRFVHKPVSFIFLLEGEKNYHLIWETLNTKEATYVWHVEKSQTKAKMKLTEVEQIINFIRVQGKTEYISNEKEPFRRIFHDYSELVEGFVKWKGELESCLT